jgi:hypothetical protein
VYNKQVTLCSNIPVTDVDLEDVGNEIIPLATGYTPASDEISLTSSFSATAYAQSNSIYCTITRNTTGAKLTQITLTGTHIINYQNQSNKQKEENV